MKKRELSQTVARLVWENSDLNARLERLEGRAKEQDEADEAFLREAAHEYFRGLNSEFVPDKARKSEVETT